MMLASVFEKAEVAERMESARRHDPATLVELQNAIFTRVRPSTRPRGNKRRGRYENKVDAHHERERSQPGAWARSSDQWPAAKDPGPPS